MTIEQKGSLIATIIAHLRFEAKNRNKTFDGGCTFFALAFKTDSELKRIAKLMGL